MEPQPKKKPAHLVFEVPHETFRQVHLAAALLCQSKSEFVRTAVVEKLSKMNLPRLEVPINEQTT